MKEILQHISEKYIPFWRSLYDGRGGFFGAFSNGIIEKDAHRGAIMHLKSLWFFSRAFQAFKDPSLKAMADHLYTYVTQKMIDPMYGGFYYTLRFDGYPIDLTKHARTSALGLYAFTAYFEISKDYSVLKHAYECFNTLEVRCRRELGYHEQFDALFCPMPNTKMCEVTTSTRHVKTMLHILEAYTDFYFCVKTKEVKEALDNIYSIVKYRVFDEMAGSFDVFMDNDLDTEYDVIDAGVNMQGSWALTSAAIALGTFVKEDVAVIRKLVDKALEECYDGTAVGYRKYAKKTDTDRLSWVQAESIIGLLNVYSLTKQDSYLEKAKNIWHYAKNNLVVNGGWYWGKTKAGKLLDKPLASDTRGPYHEGRMFLEILRRGINIGL